MVQFLNGRPVAEKILTRVAEEVSYLPGYPVLASVAVGYNQASQAYLHGIRKDCQRCGILMEEYTLLERATETEVVALIDRLKFGPVDGIILQRPLPRHLTGIIYDAMPADKDVDCVNTYNIAALTKNEPKFAPCTAQAVMELLDGYGVGLEGKRCVIVGRSLSVGRPLATMMLAKNATVTVCHSKTEYLSDICSQADILVSAAGSPGLITPDHVAQGAIVVDVGTTPSPAGLLGDVDYEAVLSKVSAITPQHGGVGPITRAVLMDNVKKAANIRQPTMDQMRIGG